MRKLALSSSVFGLALLAIPACGGGETTGLGRGAGAGGDDGQGAGPIGTTTTSPTGAAGGGVGGVGGAGGAGTAGGSGGAGTGGESSCTEETCGDGLDNDCDGEADEDCPCSPGETQSCYSGAAATEGVGECEAGTQECSGDIFGPCTGEKLPQAEQCNGKDDDCDGEPDDLGTITCGIGACQSVAMICVGGQPGQCMPKAPSVETCDGIDNDCDGQTDEELPGSGTACVTGLLGPCSAGTMTCEAGALACVPTTAPAAESCDGIDNDCDGSVDDGVSGLGSACVTGLQGVCAAGTTSCQGGFVACVSQTQATAEICNTLDDDCDGAVDDGNPGGGGACQTGLPGVCGQGTLTCQSGMLLCTQAISASAELCDGFDNDCDGAVDDGIAGVGQPCSTGLAGACALGETSCQGGLFQCLPTTPTSAETCDGVDNDCNGAVDDGNPGGGAACSSTCGPGTTACVAGSVACVSNTPADLYVFEDQSGSMWGTNYDAAKGGIKAFMAQGATAGFGLGLGFHPIAGLSGYESCDATDYATPTVAFGIAPAVTAAIGTALDGANLNYGSTPVPGFEGALGYAKAFATANPSHKVGLVLIADGLPNICGAPYPGVPTDLALFASQYAAGSPKVVTYVLSIGTDVPASSWNQIAAAGGTGTAHAAPTPSIAEVEAALASIRNSLKACP